MTRFKPALAVGHRHQLDLRAGRDLRSAGMSDTGHRCVDSDEPGGVASVSNASYTVPPGARAFEPDAARQISLGIDVDGKTGVLRARWRSPR